MTGFGRGNTSLTTPRLLLRSWTPADVDPLVALSSDPEVMRFFPRATTRAEVVALVERHADNLAAGRPGLYAVERREDGQFIGWVGLATPTFEANFMPAVEIGWRLAREFWGRGYAPEAARRALAHGFTTLGLEEVVSFTAVPNLPSRRVMEKIGMHHDPADDFDHPRLEPGHWLERHVLYRITRAQWSLQTRTAGDDVAGNTGTEPDPRV